MQNRMDLPKIPYYMLLGKIKRKEQHPPTHSEHEQGETCIHYLAHPILHVSANICRTAKSNSICTIGI